MTLLATGELVSTATDYRPRGWRSQPSRSSAFAHVPVAAMMTRDVVCVRPDVGIDAVRTLLIERRISGVPVVDAHGMPLGVVSKTDLVRQCSAEQISAAQLMQPIAVTISEHAPVAEAAAIMARERVHRVVVCSDSGEVVGIVSTFDITRFVASYENLLARDRQ